MLQTEPELPADEAKGHVVAPQSDQHQAKDDGIQSILPKLYPIHQRARSYEFGTCRGFRTRTRRLHAAIAQRSP
jgi:hypothetical protein